MSDAGAQFGCPSCGKQYRWSERIAGKQARCACGQTINVPASEPGADRAADDFDSYDVVEQPEAASRAPVSPRPVASSAGADAASSRAPAMTVGGAPVRRRAAAPPARDDTWNFKQIEVTPPLLMFIGGMAGIAIAIGPIWTLVVDGDKTVPRGVLKFCYIMEAACVLLMLAGVVVQLMHVRGGERPNGQSMVRWTAIRIIGGLALCIVGAALITTLAMHNVPRRPTVWFGGIPLFLGIGIIARTFVPNV